MDLIEGTMQTMSQELIDQKRFIVGAAIASLGVAATVFGLIRQLG